MFLRGSIYGLFWDMEFHYRHSQQCWSDIFSKYDQSYLPLCILVGNNKCYHTSNRKRSCRRNWEYQIKYNRATKANFSNILWNFILKWKLSKIFISFGDNSYVERKEAEHKLPRQLLEWIWVHHNERTAKQHAYLFFFAFVTFLKFWKFKKCELHFQRVHVCIIFIQIYFHCILIVFFYLFSDQTGKCKLPQRSN